MAWTLDHPTLFDWEWSVVHTAFGSAAGVSGSLSAAVVDLMIAEADLLEEPYATQSKMRMRQDPELWLLTKFNALPEPVRQRIRELENASGFGSKSPSYGD